MKTENTINLAPSWSDVGNMAIHLSRGAPAHTAISALIEELVRYAELNSKILPHLNKLITLTYTDHTPKPVLPTEAYETIKVIEATLKEWNSPTTITQITQKNNE